MQQHTLTPADDMWRFFSCIPRKEGLTQLTSAPLLSLILIDESVPAARPLQ